jgi:hypothetical protein
MVMGSEEVKGTKEISMFDATLQEEAVFIKIGGIPTKYILREMLGDDMEAYLEDNRARVDYSIVDGKMDVRGVKSYKGLFSSLLKRCMFDIQGAKVDPKIIDALPQRIQQPLFEKAQKLNAFTEKSQDEVGK